MMNLDDIAHARLSNQQLTRTALATPAEMVAWHGAMQAQDFAGAKWSLGVRLRPTNDAAIEKAFNEGLILRTHVLRPTWHFVTPDDIRWLLALTSPRVHQVNAGMYRQVGTDSATLKRSIDIVVKALQGGRQLARDELRDALLKEGIAADGGQRMAYIMMNAELDGIVCSGPRRGKQFTYMLLDERAPNAGTLSREEALVELIRRYFQSHGPATAADFARWSSLTLADTRAGLETVGGELHQEVIAGQTYWFANWSADNALPPREPSPTAYLLSIYDEYTIGYKDRSAIVTVEDGERLVAMGNALQNVIVIDGQIVGTWRRELTARRAIVEVSPFRPFTEEERDAVDVASRQYEAFLGRVIDLKVGPS
jgi:hypothetical protein